MTARTYVDVHVLQTVPPSNLNRDDAGSPKQAVSQRTRTTEPREGGPVRAPTPYGVP
jgi:hypothetical protein